MHSSAPRDSGDREPTPEEQAALAWVVRCDRGLSPEKERELEAWLAADATHRALFAEFGGTWRMMGHNAAEAARLRAVPGGAAAGVAESTVETHPQFGRRRQGLWLPLAAAAAIALAWISWKPAAFEPAAIATAVGALRQVTLTDGSVVALNTDSEVVTAFTAGERRIRLVRGEAFFEVAKDAARPFIVEAAGVGVRAVGTAFNVRVRPDSVEVLVTEGKVNVAPEKFAVPARATSADVGAGERVVVPVPRKIAVAAAMSPLVGRIDADEVQRALAWQNRRLEFSNTTLGEMVAEFNRYNRQQLVVSQGSLAALRFGGSFRPDDRAGFVRMLQESFGITAEERGSQTILRGAP